MDKQFMSDMKEGEQIGGMYVGEHAWHCVNAAINSLEQGRELEGLMILRTLRYYLAPKTGREIPSNKKGGAK